MNKFHEGEVWKDIPFEPGSLKYKYAVSNHGRIISFNTDIESGNILKGGRINGYKVLSVRPFGKNKTFYVHKLVAEYFIYKKSERHNNVIHLDHDKCNNHVNNLRWVTKRKMELHHLKSPRVIEAKQRRKEALIFKGNKLTATDVMLIKKKIFDPNRKTRMKLIAKRFGISEMQLYRIKSGENWSNVKLPSDFEQSADESSIYRNLNSYKNADDNEKPGSAFDSKPEQDEEGKANYGY